MESNWRFNVAEQGLSFSNIRLAARTVEFPTIWVVAFHSAPNGAYGTIETNPFSGVWGFQQISFLPFTHFPYGFDVEPDVT